MTDEPLRIIELQVENVMGLKAAALRPDGTHVIVGGRNMAGKSSLLNSIMFALGGEDAIPPKPVRDGETTGKVMLDLGPFTVQRHWTDSGRSYLEVKTRDGARYGSPQKMLDDFLGEVGADVMELLNKKPKDLADEIAHTLGLKDQLDELKRERKTAAENRKLEKRILVQKKAALAESTTLPDGIPDEPVDVQALLDEIKVADTAQAALSALETKNEIAESHYLAAGKRCEEANAALLRVNDETSAALKRANDEASAALKRANDALESAETARTEKGGVLSGLQTQITAHEVPDTTLVREALETAQATNDLVAAKAKRQEMVREIATQKQEVDDHETSVEAIDKRRQVVLKNADLPVEGLSIDEDGLSINGIPFEQLSDSQRRRLVIGIATRLNPRLRVLLLRDASLLDDESLKDVLAIADEHGFQCFLERVGDGPEVKILIEDGMVKEDRS